MAILCSFWNIAIFRLTYQILPGSKYCDIVMKVGMWIVVYFTDNSFLILTIFESVTGDIL
jgi:hypothetical protein